MALNNPLSEADATIVSANILTGYAKRNRIAQLTNQNYSGQVQGVGSTVKVVSLADVTIGDYVPGEAITREALSDTSVLLTVDQAKYFSFGIDDTATISGAGSYLAAASERTGVRVSETIDAHIAAVMSDDAGVVEGLGTAESPVDLSDAGKAYEFLVTLRTALADTGSDLVAIVPSAFVGKLLTDSRFVGTGQDALFNGEVGQAAGFRIVESNVIAAVEGNYTVLATSDMEAVATAISINKTERYRPEAEFSDAVKGLAVFGAKVIRPSAVAKAIVTL